VLVLGRSWAGVVIGREETYIASLDFLALVVFHLLTKKLLGGELADCCCHVGVVVFSVLRGGLMGVVDVRESRELYDGRQEMRQAYVISRPLSSDQNRAGCADNSCVATTGM